MAFFYTCENLSSHISIFDTALTAQNKLVIKSLVNPIINHVTIVVMDVDATVMVFIRASVVHMMVSIVVKDLPVVEDDVSVIVSVQIAMSRDVIPTTAADVIVDVIDIVVIILVVEIIRTMFMMIVIVMIIIIFVLI